MANERVSALGTQIYKPSITDFGDRDSNSLGSRKISPFDEHGNFRNSLSPRGGVMFDGTSGARVTVTLTGQNIATDAFAFSIVRRIPTSTPSAADGCLYLASSATDHNVGNMAWLFIETDGTLQFRIHGTTNSDFNSYGVANFVTNYGGRIAHITVVRLLSGSPVLYINGVSQTLVATSGGTPPTAQGSITGTYLGVGYGSSSQVPYSLPIYCATLYNHELTAADVQEIFELGGAVPERFKFGTQSMNTQWNASSANTNFTSYTATSNTAFAATQAAGQGNSSFIADNDNLPVVKVGAMFRLRFTTTVNVGSPPTLICNGASGGFTMAVSPNGLATAAGVNDIILTATKPGRYALLWQLSTTGDFSVASLQLTQLGAIVHLPLDDGLGFQLQDTSFNKLHALITQLSRGANGGVSHISPSYGPAKLRTTTNTSGNQQLCGGPVLPALCQITRIRARAQSNTPTITLGTASGGTQVVASVALSTTWKDLTIALTGGIVTSAATSLWANANSTDVVEWDITWEPLSP